MLVGCTLSCATADAWASLIVPPLDAEACYQALEAKTASADMSTADMDSAAKAPDSSQPQNSPVRDWYQRQIRSARGRPTASKPAIKWRRGWQQLFDEFAW